MNEYMKLDFLTLSEHTEKSGDSLDLELLDKSREAAKKVDCFFEERINDELAAYATIKENKDGYWFVLMFNTHPSYRNKDIFFSLFRKICNRVQIADGKYLQSNVYKENVLSVKFHHRLGFIITKENEKGIEFTLDLDEAETNNLLSMLS